AIRGIMVVKRREFVVSGGVVGAGLRGAASLAPGVLRAAEAKDLDSNFNSEEKPVAFSVHPLTYAFDALEPYIDAKTMEIHHDKHHVAYGTNLNKALEGHGE